MRHNNRKTLPGFPIPAVLTEQDTLDAAENIALTADKDSIKDTIYKGEYTENGEKKFAVRKRLRDIYFNKCAYCEDINAKPEVEHFRPKKRVTGERGHPGYYWLCYEWTNLLPSCRYCNTEGGKGNKFPIISSARVSAPNINGNTWDKTANDPAAGPLAAEQPYLLHPEIDQPDDGTYFRFTVDGSMEGIDAGRRGAETIDICNMNRETLLLRRLKLVVEPIMKSIHRMLKLEMDGLFADDTGLEQALGLVFEEMKERQAHEEPFSLFAIYIYLNFDEFITPFISTPTQRQAVSAAFARFSANHPI